jgi:hypothetical protein
MAELSEEVLQDLDDRGLVVDDENPFDHSRSI